MEESGRAFQAKGTAGSKGGTVSKDKESARNGKSLRVARKQGCGGIGGSQLRTGPHLLAFRNVQRQYWS